eukprot:1856869-Pleurochrysis_carterae.AAC.4
MTTAAPATTSTAVLFSAAHATAERAAANTPSWGACPVQRSLRGAVRNERSFEVAQDLERPVTRPEPEGIPLL